MATVFFHKPTYIEESSKLSEIYESSILSMLFLNVVKLKSSLLKEAHRIPSSYQFLFCFETSYYICPFLCDFSMLACNDIEKHNDIMYIHVDKAKSQYVCQSR